MTFNDMKSFNTKEIFSRSNNKMTTRVRLSGKFSSPEFYSVSEGRTVCFPSGGSQRAWCKAKRGNASEHVVTLIEKGPVLMCGVLMSEKSKRLPVNRQDSSNHLRGRITPVDTIGEWNFIHTAWRVCAQGIFDERFGGIVFIMNPFGALRGRYK